MVRAGVVTHPAKWKESGYQEISGQKRCHRLIDFPKLCRLLESTPQSISVDYEEELNVYLKTTVIKSMFYKSFSDRGVIYPPENQVSHMMNIPFVMYLTIIVSLRGTIFLAISMSVL